MLYTSPNPVVSWIANHHALAITKVARREHRGIRTIETADVEQHVWEELTKLALREDGVGTDFRSWDVWGITNLATKIARKYVARERIEWMHFAGAFIYTPGIVEVYLKDAVWANVEDVVDMDGRVDVQDAIKTFPLPTQRCLFIHFGLDQPYDHKSAEYKRVMRAVDSIADRLNMGSGVTIGDMSDAA